MIKRQINKHDSYYKNKVGNYTSKYQIPTRTYEGIEPLASIHLRGFYASPSLPHLGGGSEVLACIPDGSIRGL